MKLNPYIMVVTERKVQLDAFIETINTSGKLTAVVAQTADEALVKADELLPKAAIVDEQVGNTMGYDIIVKLIEKNVFIQTIVLSELSEEDFHEKYEGLGILIHIPTLPGKKECEKILELL